MNNPDIGAVVKKTIGLALLLLLASLITFGPISLALIISRSMRSTISTARAKCAASR